MPEKSPEFFTALGAIIGAGLFKIIGMLIRRKFSEADQLRREFKEEASRLRQDMRRLHDELDHWKEKYYSLAQQNVELKLTCESLKRELDLLKPEKQLL